MRFKLRKTTIVFDQFERIVDKKVEDQLFFKSLAEVSRAWEAKIVETYKSIQENIDPHAVMNRNDSSVNINFHLQGDKKGRIHIFYLRYA